MADSEIRNLPDYLWQRPEIISQPPVVTTAQELPISSLSWKNFEILCLQLAKKETDPNRCRIYGTPGQGQEGIDIYGKISGTDKYNTYQCKHVSSFGPAKIKKAVDEFLKNEWKEKTKDFVLCCKEGLNSTERENEVEVQAELLKKEGITFRIWDVDELNILLKTNPDIVHNFFGKEWLKQFCGEEVAKLFSNIISPVDATNFLKISSDLYKLNFDKADPGLPYANEVTLNNVSIVDRFVIPNIRYRRISFLTDGQEKKEKKEESQNERYFDLNGDRELRNSLNYESVSLNALDWISDNKKSIVIGDAGSGKSTLLRYSILRLYSALSKDKNLVKTLGFKLPIWIPFSFWTKKITENPGAEFSVEEIVNHWLGSFGEGSLFPMFKTALNDESALLVIDGIDEGHSLNASRIALRGLTIYLGRREGIDCLLSSRPHAFNFLKGEFDLDKWQVGELLPFSRNQKKEYLYNWFKIYCNKLAEKQIISSDIVNREIERRADTLLSLVENNDDLKTLSSNPLLLSVLLVQSLSNSALPSDRIKIFTSLLDQLIAKQPQKRKVDANVLDNDLEDINEEDYLKSIENIAFSMVTNGEVTIEKNEAVKLIKEHLKDEDDGLGFGTEKATAISRKMFDVLVGGISILSERSPGVFGFVHKSFLEFLAAGFVSRLPFEDQKKYINDNLKNLNCLQVLIFLLQKNERPDEVTTLVNVINKKAEENEIDKIWASIVLKDFLSHSGALKLPMLKQVSSSLAFDIENLANEEFRSTLVKSYVRLLSNKKVKDQAKLKIAEWLSCKSSFRTSEIEALAVLSPDRNIIEYLLRGINDENTDNARSAVRVLALFAKKDGGLLGTLKKEVYESMTDERSALIYQSLLERDFLSKEEIKEFLTTNEMSLNPVTRLMSIYSKVKLGTHTEDDMLEVAALTERRNGVGYQWRDVVRYLLLTGWSGNEKLRDMCLEVVRNKYGKRNIEIEMAYYIPLKGFTNDPKVQEWIIEEIEGEEKSTPFLMLHQSAWKILQENVEPTSELIEKLDVWMKKEKHHEPEISFAALIGKTDVGKNKLIENLDSWVPFWSSRSLLEGWGEEVHQLLLDKFNSNPLMGSHLSNEYIKIEKDKDKAYLKLLEILKSGEKAKRVDIVMRSLLELTNGKLPKEVVDIYFDNVLGLEKFYEQGARSYLYAGASGDERVRSLALRQIEDGDNYYSELIDPYKEDKEIINKILVKLFPLPKAIRGTIVDELNNFPLGSEDVLDLFETYKFEDSASLRSLKYKGYFKRLSFQDKFTSEHLEELKRGLFARGLKYETIREGSFCGLISLGCPGEALKAKSEYEGDEEFNLDHVGHEKNSVLHKSILENWNLIKDQLTDKFEPIILMSRNRDSIEDYYPFVEREHEGFEFLLDHLHHSLEDENYYLSEQALSFVSRLNIKTEKIKENLLALVLKSHKETGLSHENINVVNCLVKLYSADENVFSRLANSIDYNEIYLNESAVLALCSGWPDTDIVTDLYNHYKKHQINCSYEVFLRLVSLRGNEERIYEIFFDSVERKFVGNSGITNIIYNSVSKAVITRDSVKKFFMKEFKKEFDKYNKSIILNYYLLFSKIDQENYLILDKYLDEEISKVKMDKEGNFSCWDASTGKYKPYRQFLYDLKFQNIL